MNRGEALRLLGLDDDATPGQIKAAYKETVQILHPDKFAGNKKLQDRATEQFKNLQEAYAVLTGGTSGRASSGRGTSGRASSARSSAEKASSSCAASGQSASGRSSSGRNASAAKGASSPSRAAASSSDYASAREIEGRLAGIAAARVQLVAQRDAAYDERRTGIVMTVGGALAALVFGRKLGVFAALAAVGATALVWGLLKTVSAQRTISALSEHLNRLADERRKLEAALADME